MKPNILASVLAIASLSASLFSLRSSFVRESYKRPGRWMLRGCAFGYFVLFCCIAWAIATSTFEGIAGLFFLLIMIHSVLIVGPLGLMAGWLLYHLWNARRLIAKGGARRWYSYAAIAFVLFVLFYAGYVFHRRSVYNSCRDTNLSDSQVLSMGLSALASKDRLILLGLGRRRSVPAELLEAVQRDTNAWLDEPLNAPDSIAAEGLIFFLLVPSGVSARFGYFNRPQTSPTPAPPQ